jgi:hypothetical protein
MVLQTASRNGGGGSTSSTPPSSARHAPASSPFGAAAASADAAADAPSKPGPGASIDRTPPRNAPPSARRPWRVPPQLASVAPAAASLYHQLMSGVGGRGGSDGGGLASWAGLSSSSSSSRRGGRRISGQAFGAAVGNSRVAHAVRSNKRVAAAGLALLAVVVLASSRSSGPGRHASYSRSLVADRDNSQELDTATLAELAALNARQGGGIPPKSSSNSPRKASPTAADLPGTSAATATDLAIKALDRAELASLVQSTGFFSPDEAEAVVDSVTKGDLDSAELLKAIDEEKAKQAQEEHAAKTAAQAASEGAASTAAAATKAKSATADEVDDWFFDDLDGGDDDDDFFFGDEDEEEDGLAKGRGGRVGADDDDGFGDSFDDGFGDSFDDDEEAEDAFGFGGGSRGGGRKGAPAGRRAGGARASSTSNRRSSSSSSSPRRASATVSASRRGGGSVLDDDFEDEEGFNVGSGGGSRGGGGRRSRSRGGSSSRSSRSRSSRLVDLNDDGGDDLLLDNEDDARLFGDVDGGFDDEFDDVAADGGLPTRRSGGRGAPQFAKVSFFFWRSHGPGKKKKLTPFYRLDFLSLTRTGRLC